MSVSVHIGPNANAAPRVGPRADTVRSAAQREEAARRGLRALTGKWSVILFGRPLTVLAGAPTSVTISDDGAAALLAFETQGKPCYLWHNFGLTREKKVTIQLRNNWVEPQPRGDLIGRRILYRVEHDYDDDTRGVGVDYDAYDDLDKNFADHFGNNDALAEISFVNLLSSLDAMAPPLDGEALAKAVSAGDEAAVRAALKSVTKEKADAIAEEILARVFAKGEAVPEFMKASGRDPGLDRLCRAMAAKIAMNPAKYERPSELARHLIGDAVPEGPYSGVTADGAAYDRSMCAANGDDVDPETNEPCKDDPILGVPLVSPVVTTYDAASDRQQLCYNANSMKQWLDHHNGRDPFLREKFYAAQDIKSINELDKNKEAWLHL